MTKFWMMSGAVIAVAVAAMVWNTGPVRSSEKLLSKAQSEFATKARDALIQRQMAQAPTVSTPTAAPKSIPLPPDVFPSLEPVAAAPVAAPETPVEVAAPESRTVKVAALETPAVSRALSSPATLPVPAPPPPAAAEAAPAAKPQMASLPEEPKPSVLPKRIDVTPMPEVAKTEPPTVTRTFAEPQRQFKTERKTRRVQRERRTNDVAYRSEYRSERRSPRYSTPYNLETLRTHAPEIAAAIARYL